MTARIQLNRPERQGQHKPAPWERSRGHLAFIRLLECCVCGMSPPEAAHIRIGTDGALGRKPSDKWALPLCARCHRLDPDCQHSGEESFWRRLGCGIPYELAKTLYSRGKTNDIEGGLRAVARFRQGLRMQR